MKKVTKQRKIDMRHCREILDIEPGGYLDCIDNLSRVLSELYARRVLPKKRRPILVLVSIVDGPEYNPKRVCIEKIYSFGYLCRQYEKSEGKEFDPTTYEEKRRFKLAVLKKQGERTMAWSSFGQYCHLRKIHKQANIIDSLPRDQQEAARKKFETQNGPTMLRIG